MGIEAWMTANGPQGVVRVAAPPALALPLSNLATGRPEVVFGRVDRELCADGELDRLLGGGFGGRGHERIEDGLTL